MTRLPTTVLVGTFDTREAAEEAQRELAARGLGSEPVPSSEGHHHPDDPKIVRRGGLADLIENMFGGFLDHAPQGHAGTLARPGAWTLVAHGVPTERQDEVRTIMARGGRVDTLVGHAPARTVPVGGELLLFGPDMTAMPQAPTDWYAGLGDSPPSIPGSLDPGRPRGLLEDAVGLDPDYLPLRRSDGNKGPGSR
jgi:hypothetical protein